MSRTKKPSETDLATSGDIIPLGNEAKKLVRKHGLAKRDAAEEFYKLALTCRNMKPAPSGDQVMTLKA